MTVASDRPMNDVADTLQKPRVAVARAISAPQSFEGTAGSRDMRAVTQAIDLLGMVYSMLESPSDDNPARSAS